MNKQTVRRWSAAIFIAMATGLIQHYSGVSGDLGYGLLNYCEGVLIAFVLWKM